MRGAEHYETRRYEARLLDGPLAGAHVHVDSLPDGDPVEVLSIDGQRRGAYVLAGLVTLQGYLPYRWVSREEWAGLKGWLRLGRKPHIIR